MPRRAKPLRPGRTESQVLAQVLDALALFGIDCDRQNTGGCTDARGQYVRFGRPGNSDVTGILPASFGPAAGRRLDIEAKCEGFRPEKLSGEKRAHFDRQLARLKATCEAGGYGFWADNSECIPYVLGRIREGAWIEWEGDWPWLVRPE